MPEARTRVRLPPEQVEALQPFGLFFPDLLLVLFMISLSETGGRIYKEPQQGSSPKGIQAYLFFDLIPW